MNLSGWKKRIRELAESIEYDPHFVVRSVQRGVHPQQINKLLEDPELLVEVLEHKNGYRLVFRLSSRFQLIVGVELLEKGLYIKTAFRRFRKWRGKKLRV